jgi:addiction module HigA family antidote
MDKKSERENRITPVTPGELLWEDYLKPLGISRYRLAKEIGVPPQRIGDIVAGKRAVSADTDLRLCKYFGLTPGYWLRVQASFDIAVARERIADSINRIVPYVAAAAR